MPRWLYPDRMQRLLRSAIANGARLRPLDARPKGLPHWEWSISGNCSSPVTVEVQSRPELKDTRTVVVDQSNRSSAMALTMETRCRQCENCLKARAAHWRMKALAEWRAAPRTWLGTLTFSPHEHFMLETRTRVRCTRAGVVYDDLTSDDQFLQRHKEASQLVTRYLKRLRKEGHHLRYMMVAEAHASGLPHYHLVLHEKNEPIRHKRLVAQWPHGHSRFNLIEDARGATYAAKYLTKSKSARVRASLRYGEVYARPHDIRISENERSEAVSVSELLGANA